MSLLVPIFLLAITIVGLVSSIRSLFVAKVSRKQYFSLENIVFLILIYITVLLGFGIIFTVLDVNNAPVLIENGMPIKGDFITKLESAMYFSAITLLSVGYGDITPVGIGRWVAIVEALIGYTIPMAFVVKSVIQAERNEN
ncbi:potassium channel family protein [Litchfieldia alkalitelluris]|uniref:potassium channel family protein n=1 Tax=Litchfieldia alkalitelluris TaxID=304268 RepID=UPI001F1C1758|nr:potassium channel family protein [Litchfieldia alkalitelluris]